MSGNEPARITDGGERSKSFRHSEITESFASLGAGEAWSIAGRYSDLSANWEAGVEVFGASIGKSIAGAWEGEAADAARDAIARYTRSAQELTTPLTDLGTRVWDAAQAIVDTKSRLPEPVEEKPWWHKDSWPWVGTHRDGVIEDRQEEAQAVMNDHYVRPFLGLDGLIPVFPEPIDPTQPLDITGPPVLGSTTAGAPDGTVVSGPGGPEATASGDPQPPEATPGETTTGDPGRTGPTAAPDTDPTAPSGLDPTVPASAAPSTVPSSVSAPGSPNPGISGTPGVPGTPVSDTPTPGRGVPGTPGTVGATPLATGSSTARGPSGAGPMGAPTTGTRGGQRDEESRRGLPDYLINQDNTTELLGETPKTVPGGVIGNNPGDDTDDH